MALSADEIEDYVDEHPELFFDLQELFEESAVMKATNKQGEEASKKKKKSPSLEIE